MNRRFAAIAPLVLAACAMGPYAQNPDEYIEAFQNSNNILVNNMKKTKVFQVARPPDRILADMAILAQRCIDGKIVRSRLHEGALASSSDVMYTARAEQTPAGRNVFSMQVKDLSGSLPGQPENGMYMMAAEFSSASAGATEINIYYPPGGVYENIVDAIGVWSKNGPTACPELF